jgi:hypothetical protein
VRRGHAPHQDWRGQDTRHLTGKPAANHPSQAPSESVHRFGYGITARNNSRHLFFVFWCLRGQLQRPG